MLRNSRKPLLQSRVFRRLTRVRRCPLTGARSLRPSPTGSASRIAGRRRRQLPRRPRAGGAGCCASKTSTRRACARLRRPDAAHARRLRLRWDGEVLCQSTRRDATGGARDPAPRRARSSAAARAGLAGNRRGCAGLSGHLPGPPVRPAHRDSLPHRATRHRIRRSVSGRRCFDLRTLGDVVVARRDGVAATSSRWWSTTLPEDHLCRARRGPDREHALADRPAGALGLPRLSTDTCRC